MYSVSSREDVTVENIISFPIGPVPTSLFHDDVTMRKACKADLCHQLESEAPIRHFLGQFDRPSTLLIRDGMTLLQSMNIKLCRTFGDLAISFVQSQLSCFPSASSIIDIFDRYDVHQIS